MTTQTYWVANWQRRRRVALDDRNIVFQVTLTCSHCEICSSRVARVQDALTRSGANWRWVQSPVGWPDGVRCVSIARNPDGQHPLEQLQGQLGLQLIADSAVA